MFLLMMLVLLASALTTSARAIYEEESDNDDIIKTISYQYLLEETASGQLDCVGTLNLSLNLKDNIERIILERTPPHEPENTLPKFLIKTPLNMDTSPISLKDIPWRIRFRLMVTYKDGVHKYSNIYNINDYIDSDDLEQLYEHSEVDRLIEDSTDMYLVDGNLHLLTDGAGSIYIFDSSGNCLLTKTIYDNEILKLDELNISKNTIVIIKLQSKEKIIIKKFICNE